MDILHKVVEMYPCLGRYVRWQGIVEQIHEHSFPTTDVPIHVQALGQIRWYIRSCPRSRTIPMEERAKERARVWLEGINGRMDNPRGMVLFEGIVQILEVLDNPYSLY